MPETQTLDQSKLCFKDICLRAGIFDIIAGKCPGGHLKSAIA